MPRKEVPQSWIRGEPLVYEHASNGNHVLCPERPQYPRHSYHVHDIALIWFTEKQECDDWLKWWHQPPEEL